MTIAITGINIEPLLPVIYQSLTIIGIFLATIIGLFLLHNFGGLKLFSKHDNELTKQFLDKYPLVSVDFMNKSAKARDIENNQEVHELNKRIEHLEQYVENMNTRIENQLDLILKEFNKRG